MNHYEMGTTDIPIFDGMYDLSRINSGGSIEGATRPIRGRADIAIKWASELHHAKKKMSSGFCYVNGTIILSLKQYFETSLTVFLVDIVLGILELLRIHQRVLYIDIDVHHGDGVEEAFYHTYRVMTAYFQKFGEFFLCTGDRTDCDVEKAKTTQWSLPLKNGTTGDARTSQSSSKSLVRTWSDIGQAQLYSNVAPIPSQVMLSDASILTCMATPTASSLSRASIFQPLFLEVVAKLSVFARTWAFETGVLLDTQMDEVLPVDRYY